MFQSPSIVVQDAHNTVVWQLPVTGMPQPTTLRSAGSTQYAFSVEQEKKLSQMRQSTTIDDRWRGHAAWKALPRILVQSKYGLARTATDRSDGHRDVFPWEESMQRGRAGDSERIPLQAGDRRHVS